MQRSTFH
nr:unnamed protein product [Callosobruchus chinensis]